MAAFALLDWPWYLRDAVAVVHPAVRRLAQDKEEMQRIMEPILRERQGKRETSKAVDMLGAILAHAAESSDRNLDISIVAEDMLALGNSL